MRIHYLFSALLLVLHLSPVCAQFNGGVFLDLAQEKAQLINRTWHISSKATANQYLVGVVNDDELNATTNIPAAFSQFVIESAPDDNKWWTADGQWFYIRSASTGLYVTILGAEPGAAVGLAPLDSTGEDDHQRFRAIVTATSGWYKLRSRLSDTGAGIVLEVGADQRLYAATPQSDPSEEQKFAFNLGLPLQPEIPFCLMELNSSDYLSNNGYSFDNAPVQHIRNSDFSCFWKFLSAGNGYYFLQNLTTGQYLSNLGNTDAGAELYMSSVQDDAARWELLANRHTFIIRNKLSGFDLGTKAQNASGQPAYQTASTTLGREWRVLHMGELQPGIQTGDYQHLLDGSLPASDCVVYGPGFKRALAERAGLPPDEAYFPLLRTALADHLDDENLVDRALQNFELGNPGHRIELAYALGNYLLENVSKRNPGTWTPQEAQAIQHFTSKIMQLRGLYATRLLESLQDFLASNAGNPPSFLALWFQVLNSEDYVWPDIYNANAEQVAGMREYAQAARTLNFRNNHLNPTLSNTFSSIGVTGLGNLVNVAISSKYPVGVQQFAKAFLKLEASAAFSALDDVGQQAASQALSRTASFATFAANAIIVIDVAIMAAQSLAIEAQKVVDLQQLALDVNTKALKQLLPLSMNQVMQGYDELAKLQLVQEMDFMLATTAASGFQHNFDDSQRFPDFTLLCLNQVAIELDANGQATLEPAQVGSALMLCDSEIEYSLSATSFTCASLGSNYPVTFTARNAAYSESCTVTVTVEDHMPPTVTCKNITVPLSGGSFGTAAIGASAIFQSGSDNCSSVVHLADISDPTVYACSHIGAHTLTLTVDDFHGNTATCQAVVTVVDNTAPTVVCQNTTISLHPEIGLAVLDPAEVFQSGTDNCGVPSLQSISKSLFVCGDIGANLVTLTVNDGHGNTNTCTVTVTVVDNSAPTVECPASKVVAPTNFNPASAVVTGLAAVAMDNCSGPTLTNVRTGATAGSGNGSVDGLTFNAGLTQVTYTVTDGAGLTSSCAFSVRVGNGSIYWEQNPAIGVGGAGVALSGDQTATTTSLADGTYVFDFGSGANFTITPTKNINKLNGLTSADVTAIQQHVTNSNPLPAPFKRIAADVNKSNSITMMDATLISQVLQGNPQANAIFNTSWRFVPSSYTFPNPDIPWGFPEKIVLTGASGAVSQDFKGIKLGDVVSTWANPANFGPETSGLVFRVQDRVLEAGSEVVALFQADQLDDLNSFQFALHFDPEQLQLVEIEPLAGLPVSMDNFGTYNVAEGEIRVVWAQATSVRLSEAAPVFRLRFRALESGARLSEVLNLNDEALPAHVYNSAYAESGVELRYSASTGADPGSQAPTLWLDNQPNPFMDVTTLRFVLPEAGEAELRISDSAGQLLFSQKKYYAAGQQIETLRLEGASGVLFAELVTEQGSVVRRLLAVQI